MTTDYLDSKINKSTKCIGCNCFKIYMKFKVQNLITIISIFQISSKKCKTILEIHNRLYIFKNIFLYIFCIIMFSYFFSFKETYWFHATEIFNYVDLIYFISLPKHVKKNK